MRDLSKLNSEKLISNWKKRTPVLTKLVLWKAFVQVEKVLNEYRNSLSNLSFPASETQIMSVVKIAIVRLNVINEKHELIDTLERDDLCEFISEGALLVGMDIKDGADITAPLRN